MKKASEILFRVSKIISFVLGSMLILFAVFFFIFSTGYFKEAVVNAAQNEYSEVIGEVYYGTLLGLGIWFAIWGCLLFVNGAIANLALNEPTESHMTVNIVFGMISGCEVNLVGAIFGLIALKKEENAKRDFE